MTLPDGLATGVAIDPRHPHRLAVGLISNDPATCGIWTVPLDAFAGKAVPHRRIALPVGAFPNGLTFGGDGTCTSATRYAVRCSPSHPARPPRLPGSTNGPASGRYRTAFGRNVRGRLRIARADIAAFMLAAAGDPDTIGQIVGLAA